MVVLSEIGVNIAKGGEKCAIPVGLLHTEGPFYLLARST
jgi:hypothetical protein